MSFPHKPKCSRSQINRAGNNLVNSKPGTPEYNEALVLVNSWRMAHAYPINTFNTTLRGKVKKFKKSIVAQRLKRLPTIIDKLKRQPHMSLARMQDIGGLRAIVENIEEVRELESLYLDSKRFTHKVKKSNDYIKSPKNDGYRGVHLVFEYHNTLARSNQAKEYEGLLVELQLRTKLQHTWATSVETIGTLLGQGFKTGYGDKEWREFFSYTSSAFAIIERSPLLAAHVGMTNTHIFKKVASLEKKLSVRDQLRGLTVATEAIQRENEVGYYNLIVLDFKQKKVSVSTYRKNQLDLASTDLAAAEKKQTEGAPIDAVLVSVGKLKQLKKAYPNYFLDIEDFVNKISLIVKEVEHIV